MFHIKYKCFICSDVNHFMRFCPYNQGVPSTNSNWPAPPVPPQYGYNPWVAPSFPPWGQSYPNQNFRRPSNFWECGRSGRGGFTNNVRSQDFPGCRNNNNINNDASFDGSGPQGVAPSQDVRASKQ